MVRIPAQPMTVSGKHFCYEEDATYYSFVVVQYNDVMMFMDVNSAWCGSVPAYQVKKAVVSGGDALDEVLEYMTECLYLSVGFTWGKVDARNIIDGYIAQYYSEAIEV